MTGKMHQEKEEKIQINIKNEKQGKTKANSKIRKIWAHTLSNFMPKFKMYISLKICPKGKDALNETITVKK